MKGVYVLFHTHINTTGYYSATKKRKKSCHLQQHGPQGHYALWNKSDRESQILCDVSYMCNLKKSKFKKNTNNKPIDTKRLAGGFQRMGCGDEWNGWTAFVLYK